MYTEIRAIQGLRHLSVNVFGKQRLMFMTRKLVRSEVNLMLFQTFWNLTNYKFSATVSRYQFLLTEFGTDNADNGVYKA